jgi:hypothetical protein
MTRIGQPCADCSPPGPARRRIDGSACAILLCLTFSVATVPSAEPPAIAVNADLRHELLARQALMREPLLAPLNLGVRVHNHVAVLWGPVPSPELAGRALDLLKQVPELIEVRNELHVQTAENATAAVPPVPPPLRPLALQNGPRSPAPSTGILTGHSILFPQGSPSPAAHPEWRPPDQEAFAPAGPLLPAIVIPRPKAAETLEIDKGDWLIEAVTQIQRSEPRFRQLRVEVRGRTVRLDGEAPRWADVHDLAQRITRLAGVERLVLGEIRTTAGLP